MIFVDDKRISPIYSIGIDLGTTNCALSYVDLRDASAVSQVLTVSQRESFTAFVERSTLPSFLYLPLEREKAEFEGGDAGFVGAWVVGEMARRMTSVIPSRVAHSAKSWLGHHAVSPDSEILPWDSADVAKKERLSPLAASAAYLSYLRSAWDQGLAQGDANKSFDKQSITITVPASFDAASQEATMQAARMAGFPDTTRLLEEPQAAFYRCLERLDARADLERLDEGSRILVVDIGGGTSDFSLFRLSKKESEGPKFERIAVSNHILLGGDNIDLALAYALESEVRSSKDELSANQWQHLIALARELKERCLGSDIDEELSVALPSAGSSLIAGSKSANVSSSDVRQLLLEGFFPLCSSEARPDQPSGALQEWGLPYAPDFAVTRYLADFTRGQDRIDAVLLNGGTLAARTLRERLVEQLTAWQKSAPEMIGNAETDLAVARGAAYYGAALDGRGRRIEAGASRSTFLEVETGREEKRLICALPQGIAVGERAQVDIPELRLRVNELVRFKAYQSRGRVRYAIGESCAWSEDDFIDLPPLETEIEVATFDDESEKSIPIKLQCEVNELGLLQIRCLSVDNNVAGEWTLAFNLRSDIVSATEIQVPPKTIKEERIAAAIERLKNVFAAKRDRKKLTANRVFKGLEEKTNLAKHEWDLQLSRRIGDATLELDRTDSEAWLSIVGYLARPGFGERNDSRRIDRIWSLLSEEDKRRSAAWDVQRCILWRRLSGGLDEGRQIELFDRAFLRLKTKKGATPERIRMLGTLERIPHTRKRQLFEALLLGLSQAIESEGHPSPYLSALGSLLARSLLYGNPENVTSPEWVSEAFEALGDADWKEPGLFDAQSLFMRAARIVEMRSLNIPSGLSKRIVKKLSKAGWTDARLLPLADYVPMTKRDQATAYGESLPPGLVIK